MAEDKGLYQKYRIEKTDGTPTDPKAVYFVLRLDTDLAARRAAATYAHACGEDNPQLAADLLALLQAIEHDLKLEVHDEKDCGAGTI